MSRGSFQQRVFELTKKIPKGKVTTYKEIASKLNCKAYRAVGNALHRNKRTDIYPCYKVIKSSGEIGGYALEQGEKIKLLEKDGIKIKKGKIDKKAIHIFR